MFNFHCIIINHKVQPSLNWNNMNYKLSDTFLNDHVLNHRSSWHIHVIAVINTNHLYNKGNTDVSNGFHAIFSTVNVQISSTCTVYPFSFIASQDIILVSFETHTTYVYINAAVDCSVTCWWTVFLLSHYNFYWWTACLLSCNNF